jgi:hypothetical protein
VRRNWRRALKRSYAAALLLALAAVFVPSAVRAQPSPQPVIMQNYAPTGACTLPNQLRITTVPPGAGVYQCVSGAWTQLSPIAVLSAGAPSGACSTKGAMEFNTLTTPYTPYVCNTTWTAYGGGASGSVSGQANGVIPLATAVTTIGAQSHLDDGVTTSGTITSTEPLSVNGGTGTRTISPLSSDSATLGAQLLTSSGWTSTGWTGSFNSFTNGASNTTALSNTITLTAASTYQYTIVISGWSAGSCDLQIAGTEVPPTTTSITGNATLVYTFIATNNTNGLVLTPTSNFNGTVAQTLQLITPITNPAPITLTDSTSATSLQLYAPSAASGNLFIGNGNPGAYTVVSGSGQTGTGEYNTGIGSAAFAVNTNGSFGAAFGWYALADNTTGWRNSGLGNEAMRYNTTGSNNTGVGQGALFHNTTGSQNTSVGVDSMATQTAGGGNTAIGEHVLYACTICQNTVAVGYFALASTTSPNDNVGVGYQAGYTTTSANANVTGDHNTWIGPNSGPGSTAQVTNSCSLGNGALTTNSNECTIGNASVTAVNFGGESAAATIAAASMTIPISTAAMTVTGLPTGCVQYPCVVAAPAPQTAQAANIGNTALFASAPAGRYISTCSISITQAATASSTLPVCVLSWTDATTSTTFVASGSGLTTSTAANSLNYSTTASNIMDVKASTSVNYSTSGYASSGATPLQYKLVITLVRVQ